MACTEAYKEHIMYTFNGNQITPTPGTERRGRHKSHPFRVWRNVICNLRKKIEPDNRKPTYIKTVIGVGYKFVSRE